MQELSNTISQLDAAEDYLGVFNYVQSCPRDISHLIQITSNLLLNARFRTANILAKILSANNSKHPSVFLALSIGGLVLNDKESEDLGREGLRAAVDAMSGDQQESFYNGLMKGSIQQVLGTAFFNNNTDVVLRILDILKAGAPSLRPIFELDVPVPPLELAELRRKGREQSRLITFASPPAGAPRQCRRAVVAMRDLLFPQLPHSRPHEIGPRLNDGLNAYGWNSSFFGMGCVNLIDDYKAITAFCLQERPELLFLDEQLIEATYARYARAEMIAQLRHQLPGLKIVAVHLDPWSLEDTLFKEVSALVDAVWAASPALPIWNDPVFAGKCLQSPFPHANNMRGCELPLIPRMLFSGGVKGYNWHRAFWLTAARANDLPIEAKLSTHDGDGLSAIDSYAVYMRHVAETTCSVNFSMRPDLSRILTGRSFETSVSGALLVQEATPDLPYFFVPGEHYLEFTSFSELRAIGQFITDRPEEAEEIRRAGNAFAREHYSDDKIVGYLDKHLYFPD